LKWKNQQQLLIEQDILMQQYTTEVRRKDRHENDVSFLQQMLQKTMACTISIEREGQPLLHTAFFAYDEQTNAITFHFSKHGWAGQEISEGKRATVSLFKTGKLYTAPKATDFGCEYESIVIYGKLKIVNDPDEKMRTLDLLFQRFFSKIPTDTYKPFTLEESRQINVGNIRIDDWVGKAHYVPEIATGSFWPEV